MIGLFYVAPFNLLSKNHISVTKSTNMKHIHYFHVCRLTHGKDISAKMGRPLPGVVL
jgi:hypothetical protein